MGRVIPWLFGIWGAWHLCLAVTAVTALLVGGWDRDHFDFLLEHSSSGMLYALVGALLWDNRRLRGGTHAEEFSRGYLQGQRDVPRLVRQEIAAWERDQEWRAR